MGAIDVDHMTIYMDINIAYDQIKPERMEIFNFKESEGQKKFKMFTTNTNKFSECFVKKSFKRIRIRNGGSKFTNITMKNLINKRNFLLSKKNKKCKFCDWKYRDKSYVNSH